MRRCFVILTVLALLALAVACSGNGTGQSEALSSVSTDTDGGKGPCKGHEPPAEAVAACSGLVAGDACTFTPADKTEAVTGKCNAGRDGNGTLACMPPPPAPPQEAIDACAGLAAGDACTFIPADRTEAITGKCDAGPDGTGTLACRPEGMGRGRGGSHELPSEAVAACASLAADAACTFTIEDKTMSGTCKAGPDGSGALACMPAPPAPPQEAIDACAGLASGDACTFTPADKTEAVTGKCDAGPDGSGTLACRPEGMGPGGKGGCGGGGHEK